MAKKSISSAKRGYGEAHRRRRKALLYQLEDGTPCDYCGRPMFKDKASNFDKEPLHADHEKSLAVHGRNSHNLATRLLHATCNRKRGDGTKEADKPLKTAHSAVFEW